MATAVDFKVDPKKKADPDAPAVTYANIRRKVPAPGPIKTILKARAASYTELDEAYLIQAWYDLRNGGLLWKKKGVPGVLDVLGMPLKSSADMAINWAGAAVPTINGGPTFVAATGLTLDGVDDWIGMGITPSAGGLKYQLNSACVGVLVTDPSALADEGYLIGRATSGAPNPTIRPFSNTSDNQVALAINSTVQVTGAYTGDRSGLWIANRTDSDSIRLTRNGSLLASSDANNVTALPNGQITVGRQGTATYHVGKVKAFLAGGGLTIAQEQLLTEVVNFLFDRFKA